MGSTSADGLKHITMTEVVAGCFKFEINYSLTKDRFDIAEVYSPTFNIGGLDWALIYWPPLAKEEKIYFDLELQCKAEDVKVIFNLTLVDRDGNPSLKTLKRASHTFSHQGESFNMVPRGNTAMVDPDSLHVHLGGLMECQETSDVIFNVYGQVIHAHRAILAARSPVFKAELFSPMVEATKGHIMIKE